MLHSPVKSDPAFRHAHELARVVHAQQVARPQELLNEDRHRVLLLTLEPGDALPEQYHLYAGKMLVALEGCATIMQENTPTLLYEGDSCSIPFGTRHRIINSGKIPLRLLEIRSGTCVEDDDAAPCSQNR